jgi:hypothetical protein
MLKLWISDPPLEKPLGKIKKCRVHAKKPRGTEAAAKPPSAAAAAVEIQEQNLIVETAARAALILSDVNPAHALQLVLAEPQPPPPPAPAPVIQPKPMSSSDLG